MAPGERVFGEAVEAQREPVATAALVHLEPEAVRVDESRRDGAVASDAAPRTDARSLASDSFSPRPATRGASHLRVS